jgi:hypothetical protein
MRHLLLLCVLTACGAPSKVPPSNNTPAGELVLDARGLGQVDARTPAKLEVLQSLFPKLAFRTESEGDRYEQSGGKLTGGNVFEAMLGGERLFYVVPYEDGSVFYLQVTSPKIRVADRPWLVGGKVDHRTIDECECWGDKATCFKTGEHLAIATGHDCKGMRYAKRTISLDVVEGATIERIVWSPQPFEKEAREAFPGEED